MKEVYIIAAKRSPIGSFLGQFAEISIQDLGNQVLLDLMKSAKVQPNQIDEVIVGNVLSAGLKQNLARQLSLKAKIPSEICAYTINMVCGSGMKTIFNAYQSIAAGFSNLVIAGGIEHMSSAPYLVDAKIRSGIKTKDQVLIDSIIHDGLVDATSGKHMGLITEELNDNFNFSRSDQDDFAIESMKRLGRAISEHTFINEITPIRVKDQLIREDQFGKKTFTIEKIRSVKPAFKESGTITAANASSLADGASFILLASQAAVEKYQLKPLAKIIDIAQVGIEPNKMGLAPVTAITNNLSSAHLELNQITKYEINEAFSLQVLAVVEELSNKFNVSKEEILKRLNINGGAIALGHPIGASGNRIVVSLINQLEPSEYGLASVCVGGGMGLSIIIKKL